MSLDEPPRATPIILFPAMSFLKHRPHRKHFKALWPGHSRSKASASTNNIPGTASDTDDTYPLHRSPSDPTPASPIRRTPQSRRSTLSHFSSPVPLSMTGRATITFSQAGVQPPVYIVTSLSNPAWETLEMNVEDRESEGDHLLFTRHFDDAAEGSYQYKIRIGEGHWVLDESKDSAPDDSGNRNNIVHVKHVTDPAPADATDVSASEKRQDSVQLEHTKSEHESNPHPLVQDELARASSPVEDTQKPAEEEPTSNQVPSIPVPFTVVEKVSDQPHEAYGDIEAASLHEDSTKRDADAEPDFETVQPPSPVATKDAEPASPTIPIVVVEKTDDKPSFGDDFGDNATSGQKFAHEQRLADATPDEVVVSPEVTAVDSAPFGSEIESSPDSEPRGEPGPLDEETAPLFRHESFVSDNAQEPAEESKSVSMDTIEEESAHSSTDRTDSQILTPDEEEGDELDNGPLLSHETGFSKDEASLDELENGPLLAHETGFSGYDDNKEQLERDVSADSGYEQNGYDDEGYEEMVEEADNGKADTTDSEHAPNFPHETVDEDDEGSQAPLLPHEQESAVENGPVLEREPTFSYEAATPIPISEQEQDSFFATRTRTGSLPHTIPRSDEDDEDLNDPSLEAFPTDRESILARVATISSSLPEDQTKELERVESSGSSVLSNACSSISLAPRSGSLKSVVEEDNEPGSDTELPSPVLLTSSGPTAPKPIGNDADIPSLVEHAKRTVSEAPSTKPRSTEPTEASAQSDETSAARSAHTSEADSVQKNDGANDGSRKWEKLYDSVATPSNTLQPPTPPLTPKKRGTTSSKETGADTTSQENQENTPTSEPTKDTPTTPHPEEQPQQAPSKPNKDTSNPLSSKAGQQYPRHRQKDPWTKGFAGVVFGPVGRLFASCFGGPKQASTTLLVLGLAIAAYYYLYASPSLATSSIPASA